MSLYWRGRVNERFTGPVVIHDELLNWCGLFLIDNCALYTFHDIVWLLA